jgi:ABC-2 type transport system ATP-binding protein
VTAPAIELLALTRSYGARRGVIDLDLAIEEGEVFGWLGPNGSGKTTTIRVLMGFIAPTSGRARIFGRDAWTEAAEAHRSVAFVSGEPAYLGDLTAGQTLGYLAVLRGLPTTAWRPLAERLDLDPRVPIRKLSRGNRQKIGVVQAFMGHEPLLVMDEPTTGLDPIMQREFLALVREARGEGRTVFLSSHNLPEVERACDRVGIIRDGRLIEVRAVRELLGDHWRTVTLALGSPPAPGTFDLPDVRVVADDGPEVRLLVRGDLRPLLRLAAGLDLGDMSIVTPDIEDVFIGYYDQRPQPAMADGAAATARTERPA